jgi:multiple sugar transport system permease protein
MAKAITLNSRPAGKRPWRYILGRKISRVIIYLIAVAIAVVSIIPFIWTISTSFKSGGQIMAIPPQLIPNPPVLTNFTSVFQGFGGVLPFGTWVINSIELSALNIFGEIFFSAIAGFGFARFRFRARKVMFILMLSGSVVPGMVKMLPMYMMFSSMKWTDSYLPLILPNWFGGMFLTFLFYQYFCTIPKSLDESAKLDGANELDIFLKIILPLSKPILATAGVMVFMFNWNNFLGPFIYIHSVSKYTLAVGLQYMRATAYTGISKEPLLAAYALLMSIPVIIVFFIFQRYFVQGIQLSVAKE